MWLKRLWQIGWKLAIVAGAVALVIYQLHFAPAAVHHHVVAAGPITAEVMGTGTLEARVQATISAKIAGRIAQVYADQGDRVTEGQLLVTLDDGDLHQQVEMARAELAIAHAGVERADAEITRAEATARLAKLERDRTVQMRRGAAATEHELSVANERSGVADADLKRAQLARVELERQVLKAEETLRYYQERLEDTRIVSPFNGLVVLRSREPGDIVVPGSAIMQVIRTDRMWVSAWVDESVMSDLAVGQPARVVFRSQPDQFYRGEVARLASQTDRETREFVVDVTVDQMPQTWAVGQRAEVYIQTAHKDQVVLAPQRAIVWRGDRSGVFIADAGRARWREVKLGLHGETAVEVIEGLVGGEQLVWPAAAGGSLTDGKAVKAP
jgi:HlyD family secretion protein